MGGKFRHGLLEKSLNIKDRQVTDLDVTDWRWLGPRIPFCATGVLWGRVRPLLDDFSKHLSSVLGRTELCHEVRNPGPPKPKSSATKTTIWHCSNMGPNPHPRSRNTKNAEFTSFFSEKFAQTSACFPKFVETNFLGVGTVGWIFALKLASGLGPQKTQIIRNENHH